MKNIHIIPTVKPSRLFIINKSKMFLSEPPYLSFSTVGGRVHKIEGDELYQPQYLYITSDEDINENNYIITKDDRLVQVSYLLSKDLEGASKVILTTDTDLIADGVQGIDDEFLEWFVKNPSCERVEIIQYTDIYGKDINKYKIIIPQEELCSFCKGTGRIVSSTTISGFKTCDCINIPQEEPKQETIEDAAERILFENTKNVEIRYSGERYSVIKSMIDLVKWQQEQDKNKYSKEEVKQIIEATLIEHSDFVLADIPDWFEQFSKLKNG